MHTERGIERSRGCIVPDNYVEHWKTYPQIMRRDSHEKVLPSGCVRLNSAFGPIEAVHDMSSGSFQRLQSADQ